MADPEYQRILSDKTSVPDQVTPAVGRLLSLLVERAEGFAAACRANPKNERDADRSGVLLCAVGLGEDEATGFLRALDEGVITLAEDGAFGVPTARACSPNLHLMGREGDHVKLHNEVLIHVTAYAELVLDLGWSADQIVFDPFFGSDALDLWGYESAAAPDTSWREGKVVFAAEAKSRVKGGDGLLALLRAFEQLEVDPGASVSTGHQRKWDELVRLSELNPIEVLLVADGARWWFKTDRHEGGLQLRPLDRPLVSAR